MASATKRRLAAIVAADVAGYSRLVASDEEGTILALRAHRRELIDDLIASHGGRIANTAGDSLLLEFPSAVDAVRCAIAVQHGVRSRNADVSPERQIWFRIGINIGDVVADGADLLGDGVNVAARLESLAAPGGVAISDDAHRQVRDRMEINWQDGGHHEVKNLSRPLRVWRWSPGGGTQVPAPPHGRPATPHRPSIAVLPFGNMSGEAEQEYFADGITEDILTELSRFGELHVVSRSSAFSYKGKAMPAREIGRELNVRYVLEGSIRRAGNRVRVVAQLIDAQKDRHVWAERYDRDLEDIFAVQDEVTREIVATLAGRLVVNERHRARTDKTGEPEAYDLLLRGREIWYRFTPEANREARRHYRQAIALDPEYARAYSSLAWTYIVDFREAWTEDPNRALKQALDVSRTGVERCPTAHSVHLTLGQALLHEGRHDEAIGALETALDLNPNDTDSYVFLARALAYSGRAAAALNCVQEAMRLNPSTPDWYLWTEGVAHFVGQDYDAAVAAFRRIKSPEDRVLRWLAASCGQCGLQSEARSAAEEYLRRNPHFSFSHHRATEPFRNPDDLGRYLDGLMLAGFAK